MIKVVKIVKEKLNNICARYVKYMSNVCQRENKAEMKLIETG